MNELIKQVEQWSKDKQLDKADPNRQALKVWEETGEIGAALSRNKLDDLKDGIGDTVVTLIILAQQHGWSLEECLQYAYDEIKDRRGVTRNGTFIKESDYITAIQNEEAELVDDFTDETARGQKGFGSSGTR